MSRRPRSSSWCALAAEELEDAALGELALARGVLDARTIGAARKKGALGLELGRVVPTRVLAELRAQARARVGPCPACGIAYVREGRPEDARCVHCGAFPDAPSDDSHEAPTIDAPESVSSRADDTPTDPASQDGPRRRRQPVPILVGPGDRFEKWTIERRVGRGGMGVVFAARGDDGSVVALKIMARTLTPSSKARFVREGRAAARLDHPGIVRVLDAGDSAHGPWIAMELVDGQSLDVHVASGPLAYERVLEIGERLARAMDHAHRRGIVHRDLKPQNVILDAAGAPRIVDFGLAKDLDGASVLTTVGHALGTPAYMAPEQVEGKPDQIGVAADVHALGAILYQLATGKPPFTGKKVRDVFIAILRDAPEAPSKRRPGGGLTDAFDAVVARALAKRPLDRYATALELAEDLSSLRRGQAPRHVSEARASSSDPALALVWGDRVGPYELRYVIGRGAAAVVFKAVDRTGEAFALKVLRDRHPERLRRFEREVRLLALLTTEAPGFVPLVEHGSSAAGPWLAMPFLAGGTLRDRLERGALAPELAVATVGALAEAMVAAHARGISHRDLKPENVLFTEDGEPRIADLGLAHHFTRSVDGGSESVTISCDGRFVGTVGYVAPEQLDDPRTAGPPADVFALGAILYECLVGLPAFRAKNPVALTARLASATHDALGSEKAAPETPPWLVAIVEKALRRDPRQRFPDAAGLALALARRDAGSGIVDRVRSLLGTRRRGKKR